MKKIIIILLSVVAFDYIVATEITDLNIDPKNPSSAPSYALFTNAQRTLMNTLTSSNVNLNIYRLIVQYSQETTADESNYDLATRDINDAVWDALYRDVLFVTSRKPKTLIPTDVANAEVQKNELAITDILEVDLVLSGYYLWGHSL